MVLFFVVSQIIASIGIAILTVKTSDPWQGYLGQVIVLTGISDLLAMMFALWFYRKDRMRRVYGRLIPAPPGERMHVMEVPLLLFMGAGLASYANILVGMIQVFFQIDEYQNLMEAITAGKSLGMMIFWMGIVAPAAEEIICRWLVYLRLRDFMGIAASVLISGAVFGIYHGNIVQAVYGGILGMVFALILEMSGNLWSCVLLHMGANTASLIWTEIFPWLAANGDSLVVSTGVWLWFGLLLAVLIFGIIYFRKKGQRRGYRAV